MNGAWLGGPCPQCGDDMPARVVHCRTCRALLNSELTEDSVEIPVFVPLPELAVVEEGAASGGHYVECPGCHEELRIHARYWLKQVQCKHCRHTFRYDKSIVVKAIYTKCPHCQNEIRANSRYVGMKVACKFCGGHLQLHDAIRSGE
ncbi:MAG: zinc ribbon domain-containing protein [Planctomyces sp.]|nr:zinc ribbon domain-containing protein [Planctomyces sp.]